MLTTAEIAARLGVTPSTVRAYHARGQMPPATGHLGRTPYWDEAAIAPWLAVRHARLLSLGRQAHEREQDAREQARTMAQVTGSRSATYTVERRLPSGELVTDVTASWEREQEA